MNVLLELFGLGLACLLGIAVVVAGWEHLAREAAASQPPDAHRVPHPGLETDASPEPAGTHAPRAAMAAAISRAAWGTPVDGTAWMDTCPLVALGPAGEAEESAEAAEPPATVETAAAAADDSEALSLASPGTAQAAAAPSALADAVPATLTALDPPAPAEPPPGDAPHLAAVTAVADAPDDAEGPTPPAPTAAPALLPTAMGQPEPRISTIERALLR